jgi:hypothetical protein
MKNFLEMHQLWTHSHQCIPALEQCTKLRVTWEWLQKLNRYGIFFQTNVLIIDSLLQRRTRYPEFCKADGTTANGRLNLDLKWKHLNNLPVAFLMNSRLFCLCCYFCS